jgi:hypothetical protein
MEPALRDRNELLTTLTTEHFALQSARSATITESLGRSTIYLGSLSASLVALALIAQGEKSVDDFRVDALVILPALVFLGMVTFVRILETGIEDAIYSQGINRIRHYYLELAGEESPSAGRSRPSATDSGAAPARPGRGGRDVRDGARRACRPRR